MHALDYSGLKRYHQQEHEQSKLHAQAPVMQVCDWSHFAAQGLLFGKLQMNAPWLSQADA